MYNRDVFAFDVVDNDLSNLSFVIAVPEEEEVAALEGRFHRAGKDHDDGGGRVGDDREGLPHHKGSGEYEGKVEDLLEGLPWVGQRRPHDREHFDGVGYGGTGGELEDVGSPKAHLEQGLRMRIPKFMHSSVNPRTTKCLK